MPYTAPTHHTREQQVSDWALDQLADAAHAEAQAEAGPFFPERGITAESLRAYAADCRAKAAAPGRTLQEALRGSGTPLPQAR